MYVFIQEWDCCVVLSFGKCVLTFVGNFRTVSQRGRITFVKGTQSQEALTRSDKDSFKGLRVRKLETQRGNTQRFPMRKTS